MTQLVDNCVYQDSHNSKNNTTANCFAWWGYWPLVFFIYLVNIHVIHHVDPPFRPTGITCLKSRTRMAEELALTEVVYVT